MSHTCSCTCSFGSGCFSLKNSKPTTVNVLNFNTVDGWPSLCAQPTLDNLQGYGLAGSQSVKSTGVPNKVPNQYYYKSALVYPDEWIFADDIWVQAKNIVPPLQVYSYKCLGCK